MAKKSLAQKWDKVGSLGGPPRARERPAKYTTAQQGGRSVDLPGIIFATLVVVFVLWPAAQWAFDL
jgi:hypothetical protein